MKIPKTIKVGGIIYTIEYDRDLMKLGETNLAKKTITIRQMEKEAMKQTFIHELFHAFNSEIGEVEVEFLCQMLFGVIVDNPGIFSK